MDVLVQHIPPAYKVSIKYILTPFSYDDLYAINPIFFHCYHYRYHYDYGSCRHCVFLALYNACHHLHFTGIPFT